MPVLKARGSDGAVAIYTGTDDLPHDNPLAHLSRVLFHSNLQYPAILYTVSGSITFPARAANSLFSASQNLFAHGRGGFPMVFGQFDNLAASPVTLAGSVPVQCDQYGCARWVSLGADSTFVRMHELCLTHVTAGHAAITLNYTIYVTDTLL